jgi:hypothetical protein
MESRLPQCFGVENVKRTQCLFVLAVGLLLASPARAEWFVDLAAGMRYDSNLNAAQDRADIRADTAATLNATGGFYYALSGADSLTLSVDARSELYRRFHGMNDTAIGVGGAYRHKFGLGYAAPWLSLAVSASHDNYVGNIRDGERLDWRAETGRRFSEAFDASFGGMYARRYARNGEAVVPGVSGKVFDVHGETAFVRAGYALSDQLHLGARVSVRRGDVVSTTRQNFEIFMASDAIAPDPTFGNDFFAYRLRGTTQTASLSLSWALSERASLNLAFADERTRAYEGLDYRGRVANMTLAYNY